MPQGQEPPPSLWAMSGSCSVDHAAETGRLAGDKRETAINIGFACSLLRNDMLVHNVTSDTPEVIAALDKNDAERAAQLAHAAVGRQLDDVGRDPLELKPPSIVVACSPIRSPFRNAGLNVSRHAPPRPGLRL